MDYKIRYYYNAFRRWWYKNIHGIEIGLHKSMLPITGESRYGFGSVVRKGDIIEIYYPSTDEMVRLIPYTPNLGVMVETWREGKMIGRRTDSRDMWFNFTTIQEKKTKNEND